MSKPIREYQEIVQIDPLHSPIKEWNIVGEMEVHNADPDTEEWQELKERGCYPRQCGVCLGEGDVGDIDGRTAGKSEARCFKGYNFRVCPVCNGAGWLAVHIDNENEYLRLKKRKGEE